MIYTNPTPGNHWTEDMEQFGPDYSVSPTLHVPSHERVSELLGPDGEPLMVPFPRPKIGFDLTKKRGED